MKKVFYWLSIVLPLVDAICGVRDGIRKAAEDVKNAAIEKKNAEMRELWNKVNGSDGLKIDDKGGTTEDK